MRIYSSFNELDVFKGKEDPRTTQGRKGGRGGHTCLQSMRKEKNCIGVLGEVQVECLW